MSLLFTPAKIGDLEVKNRFVHSATCESMADETGKATEMLVERYRDLALGEVGLIIPGYMYVHPLGRTNKLQAGIHSDEMIPGLARLADAVHAGGGAVAFQLAHGGRQTTREVIGQRPMAPSSKWRDPLYFVKPREMSGDEILETIEAFGRAAGRAAEAGADAVQLHCAHGYLVNQFLSPFLNLREDGWGGSPENRFRFLEEVVLSARRAMPRGMPLFVKLSTNDYTPREGITPQLACTYARWLVELGIDAVEVSSGGWFSFMNTLRGGVPVRELMKNVAWYKKPAGRVVIGRMVGKYDLEEGYHLEAARTMKPVLGDVPLILVGGLRSVPFMEEVLRKGEADFVSLSRPFIRDPHLVRKIREGQTVRASCTSCNKCIAAIFYGLPLRCYRDGFQAPSRFGIFA
jgi:2,4-dienoyl-CoA reductase-like NADH-dependent reductase (Old Yellow Enzyme family)